MKGGVGEQRIKERKYWKFDIKFGVIH